MPYLEIDNLHKTFITPGGRAVNALRGVSFKINQGEILCVTGHNGAGKSTLLNCLRGLFTWDDGDILLNGKPIEDQKINIVSVFQEVELGVIGSMTPMENLSLVFSRQKGFLHSLPKKRFRKQIKNYLRETGLRERFESFDNTPVSELSGGQRQQVGIMMAIMRNPQMLLLDEFVSNLDEKVRTDILFWMHTWIRKRNITTIMVTHDEMLAENWGDWLIELSEGNLIRFERNMKDQEKFGGSACSPY